MRPQCHISPRGACVIHAPKSQVPEPAAQDSTPSALADRWAIGLSALCLAHCLAIPVALLLFPLLAHELVHHQTTVHWVLLVIALPLSTYALLVGYRRHRRRGILTLGALGMLIMTAAVTHVAGVTWELPLSLCGALLLAWAHLQNIRQNHA